MLSRPPGSRRDRAARRRRKLEKAAGAAVRLDRHRLRIGNGRISLQPEFDVVTLEHALSSQGLLPPGLEFDAGAPTEERKRSRAALTNGLVRLVDLVSLLETRFSGALNRLLSSDYGNHSGT
jgi:hypothetical protein